MISRIEKLKKHIFEIDNERSFNEAALEVFKMQSEYNPVYKRYIESLKIDPNNVSSISEIPFLPIEFFKSQKVLLVECFEEIIFTSSGTTGMQQSRHFVPDVKLYEKSFLKAFNHFFGQAEDYCILALLPSYMEREGSSLIYMTDALIKGSKNEHSGFFLNNLEDLVKTIKHPELRDKKILLLGVSFALLDLAEQFELNHPHLMVMETGGMKGRRKEMIREELHTVLTKSLNVKSIYSEYGMTELLSQAYSFGEGVFNCPPWMKIMIRDANDPFSFETNGKSGGINVIDLANIYSCSFIMTQDLGKKFVDESFEVLGRFDSSDIRGCNLLIQ